MLYKNCYDGGLRALSLEIMIKVLDFSENSLNVDLENIFLKGAAPNPGGLPLRSLIPVLQLGIMIQFKV